MVQEENTIEIAPSDKQRRNFLKSAAATGAAAIGLGAFSGSAAAQPNVRQLELGDVQVSGGLVTVQVQNLRIIRDVTITDNVVTIIGDDLTAQILNNVTVNFEDSLIEINKNDVDVDILNDSVVLVSVALLGDNDTTYFGSTFDGL